MTDARLVLAASLAAATLALWLAVIAMGGALRAGLAPWPGVAVVVMATAAFVLSGKEGSFLVAGLLAASGAVGLIYGLVATQFLAAATFPGARVRPHHRAPRTRARAGEGRGDGTGPGTLNGFVSVSSARPRDVHAIVTAYWPRRPRTTSTATAGRGRRRSGCRSPSWPPPA